LGTGLGFILPDLEKEIQNRIFKLGDHIMEFSVGLGFGLGNIITSLSKEFQNEIFDRADNDFRFAFGLGYDSSSLLRQILLNTKDVHLS
jgi:hypothetical protein